jgi:hypothetical protein
LLCICLFPFAIARTGAQTTPALGSRPTPQARVVIVEDPGALHDLQPIPEHIQTMVDHGITTLTHKDNATAAWRSIVSTNDVVGLKVLSSPGRNSGTRPDVVAAVVKDLLAAGLAPGHIIIWDRHLLDLRAAGFVELSQSLGVRVEGSVEAGYDDTNSYDRAILGTLTYGDHEFGKTGEGVGRRSFVSNLVSRQITKVINITPMLHHNVVGVSGNLYSLAFGSVDNISRFEYTSEDISRAVPEIYAMPSVGDRVVLNLVDALICQYDGQERGELHYSVPLFQLRFSRDPVALDVLSLQEINHERELADVPVHKTADLYSNASLLEIGVSDAQHIEVEKIH